MIALISAQGRAQRKAEISAISYTYDFGIIPETDEGAAHTFRITNTGTAALVVGNVSASCGCTLPEWTKAPIEPGDTGEVRVSYLSKGRPGPFYKSVIVHSNAARGRLTLYIKGTVAGRKPEQPAIVYAYRAGDLRLDTKIMSYNRLYPGDKAEGTIHIKNEGSEALSIAAEKIPAHLSVECNPPELKAGEAGELSLLFHTDVVKQMGRIDAGFHLKITSKGGGQPTDCPISVKANIIDNFSELSAAAKAKAPVAEYSRSGIDFGKLAEKGGSFIPFMGGGNESESLKISNKGKSTLIIYSISCDNSDAVTVSGGKREIKPGASAAYKIVIHPKAIKAGFEAFVHVVSNDPGAPVKMIKVTAEK
ncbi:MAG: DUF1573 domain-containing protein [Tannerellaceae bacterium]|nr:DUF1573 domain-containing protein [Tannerellaceae bacterium]